MPRLKRLIGPVLTASLLWLAAAGLAAAVVVSGQVTSPGGAPLADVDLDFKDVATGAVLPTVNDNTDLLGFYAVDVPPGTYDIQYEPAAGERFVAHEALAVVVGATPLVLDEVLEPGFLLTARIVDESHQPIAGGKLDVRDPMGVLLFSPHDRAGADGLVSPVVPAGTWELKYSGPVGGIYLPVLDPPVLVSADRDAGDVVLPLAFSVTGRVVGADGPPLASARVVAVDLSTGLPAEGAGDVRSNSLGIFELRLPPGDHRLDVTPAFGDPYEPRSFHGLQVAGIRELPDLPLDRAGIVDGRVIDQRAAAVEAADLDFDETHSGRRLPTIQDDSDVFGRWQVVLPFETWDVSVDPPPLSALVAADLQDVIVDSDRTLPDLVLLDGVGLSARVLGPGGAPAEGVNVDVRDSATGLALELYDDKTDAAGRVTVFVPPGTWNVAFRPPALSGWALARRDAVAVSAARDLGDVSLAAAVPASVAAVSPVNGPELGGTLVSISGSGFADGARVLLDGRALKGVVRLDASTLQGTTRAHHRGAVTVEVVNPGAAAAALAEGFTYERGGDEPLLRLRKDGPFRNDVLLEWTAVGGPGWSVYSSDSPRDFGRDRLVRETGRQRWRQEGGGERPGLDFYVVH